MKLHVLSDLHREFASFKPSRAAVAAADVVVLAGDIDQGTKGIEWAANAFKERPIIYVCGNHELYGEHWDEALLTMREAAERRGVHFLENESIEIDGVRFLGATLWTDFALYGQQESSMELYQTHMNDCLQISAATEVDPYARLTPGMVLNRHDTSRAWLRQHLEMSYAGPTVVVTHHAPSSLSVARRYYGSPLNPSFASGLPQFMLQAADLWIHGHMHDACSYDLEPAGGRPGCKVVCNPRGYPRDQSRSIFKGKEFNPSLLVHLLGA